MEQKIFNYFFNILHNNGSWFGQLMLNYCTILHPFSHHGFTEVGTKTPNVQTI